MISTPVAIVSGVTAAARNGVLIKGGVRLEAMGGVRVVALDKTGTLSRGHPGVVDVMPAPGEERTPGELLAMAAALERHSEHPLAKAMVLAGDERRADSGATTATTHWVEAFESIRGKGVRARLDGQPFVVGKPGLFDNIGALDGELHRPRGEGRTVVAVGPPAAPWGLLVLADRPRPDVGIDDVRANLMPEDKVRIVEELEPRYGCVAMVDDDGERRPRARGRLRGHRHGHVLTGNHVRAPLVPDLGECGDGHGATVRDIDPGPFDLLLPNLVARRHTTSPLNAPSTASVSERTAGGTSRERASQRPRQPARPRGSRCR